MMMMLMNEETTNDDHDVMKSIFRDDAIKQQHMKLGSGVQLGIWSPTRQVPPTYKSQP